MKFEFNEYVQKNVKLLTNIKADLQQEIQASRQQCLKEFSLPDDIYDDEETRWMTGVRVGDGFLDNPTTMDSFILCNENIKMLQEVRDTLSATVFVSLNDLLAHYADYYMNSEMRREMERYSGSLSTPEERLWEGLNKDVIFQLFSAFNLGKLDGFQDGGRMVRTIFGCNPADGCWYDVVKTNVFSPTKGAPFVQLPMNTHKPSDRRQIFKVLLHEAGNNNNVVVLRPNQNANLKAAWAATQHATIFGSGPYHDPNAPNRKKVIPADPPDTRRICLPMALNGRCFSACGGKHDVLSDAEVQRVAAAGGFNV